MELWVNLLSVFIGGILGSTGLWTFLQTRNECSDNRSKMLMGLAHDRILELGTIYIERGYITPDEYENLIDYLYKPYSGLNGNGSAKRIVEICMKLPIKSSNIKNN